MDGAIHFRQQQRSIHVRGTLIEHFTVIETQGKAAFSVIVTIDPGKFNLIAFSAGQLIDVGSSILQLILGNGRSVLEVDSQLGTFPAVATCITQLQLHGTTVHDGDVLAHADPDILQRDFKGQLITF